MLDGNDLVRLRPKAPGITSITSSAAPAATTSAMTPSSQNATTNHSDHTTFHPISGGLQVKYI